MSKLVLNTEAAERQRGCVFAENFDSAHAVVENGGTINGSPSISNFGASFDDTLANNLYYSNEGNDEGDFTIILDCKLTSTGDYQIITGTGGGGAGNTGFAIQVSTNGNFMLEYTDGTHRVFSGSANTFSYDTKYHVAFIIDRTNDKGYLYVDGVKVVEADISSVTDATTKTGLYIGRGIINSYPADGTISNYKFFKGTVLTEQEILDYANNATYNYMNEAKGLWIGTSANNDPSNVRWLDASGNGNHAEYGDGSTPSTYPTKNAKLGYSFDSGDYFTVPQSPTINITDNLTTFWMGRISNINKAAMLAKRTAYNVKLCYALTGFAGVVSFVVSQNGTSSFTVSAASDLTESPVVESITGTYEPSTALKVYRNGAIAGENTTSIPSSIYSTESNNLEVGAVNQGLPYFTGNESCVVGIWNKTLTPMQIIDLHLWAMRQVNKI